MDKPILSQKINCSSFDIYAYPLLVELAEVIVAITSKAFSEITETEVDDARFVSTMSDVKPTFTQLAEGTGFYRINNSADEDVMTISLAPGFIAALSEHLLGGAFSMEDKESAAVGALDFELSQSILAAIIPAIRVYFHQNLAYENCSKLSYTLDQTIPEQAKKIKTSSNFVNVKIETKSQDGPFCSLFTFHFPLNVLEQIGVLDLQSKTFDTHGDNTQWRANMCANVENISIEIQAIIEKYKTNISKLSRLEVGDMIPLNPDSMHALDMVVKTEDGVATIGRGRLGAYKNLKAVRLSTDLGLHSLDLD